MQLPTASITGQKTWGRLPVCAHGYTQPLWGAPMPCREVGAAADESDREWPRARVMDSARRWCKAALI